MRWVSLLTTILVWLRAQGQDQQSIGERAASNLERTISWLNASIEDSKSKRNDYLGAEISGELKGCLDDTKCTTELDASADKLNRLANGLDGGKEILDGLLSIAKDHVEANTGLLKPFAKTFLPKLAKLAPFLGALGPIVNMFATLVDSNEVQLLVDLKNTVVEGFRRMEFRFQQLENKLDAISTLLKKTTFWKRVQQFKSKLNGVEVDIREYLTGANEAQRKIYGESFNSRDTLAQDGIEGLLRIFKGDSSGAPLCDDVRTYSKVDRNKVRKISAVLLRCVMIGVQHRLFIMEKINAGKDGAKEIIERAEETYVASITEVANGITECDEAITERYWKDQWKEDVLADIRGQEWIKPPRKTAEDADIRCRFSQGDGTSAGEINLMDTIKFLNGTVDLCVDLCIYLKREQDDSINGVTTSRNGTKNCWCEKTMTGRDTNSKYKSCFLQLNGQHDDVATRIYNFLVEKYSWRMWYVVVFDQMSSAEYHLEYCKKQNEFMMEVDIKKYTILITSGSYSAKRETRRDSLSNIVGFTKQRAIPSNNELTDIFSTIKDRSRGKGNQCEHFYIKGLVKKNGQLPWSGKPSINGFAAKAPSGQYQLKDSIDNGWPPKKDRRYREFYVFILG